MNHHQHQTPVDIFGTHHKSNSSFLTYPQIDRECQFFVGRCHIHRKRGKCLLPKSNKINSSFTGTATKKRSIENTAYKSIRQKAAPKPVMAIIVYFLSCTHILVLTFYFRRKRDFIIVLVSKQYRIIVRLELLGKFF